MTPINQGVRTKMEDLLWIWIAAYFLLKAAAEVRKWIKMGGPAKKQSRKKKSKHRK